MIVMDTISDVALDAYPIRCLVGLVASLSLVIALVHLPLQRSSSQVGWTTNSSADRILLSDVVPEEPTDAGTEDVSDRAPPPTNATPSSDAASEAASTSETVEDDSGSRPSDSNADRTKEIKYASTLDVTDHTPRIVGGKGSLYLNISYPKEARAQGIEGRLELEFLVEPDGSVTNIDVAESLHPLCDSAAVDGVRSVDFIPARVDGTPVPIRLRLPVRFKMSTPATAAQASPGSP
ncbi:energy transducer TonB [Salinibacter grassmerensis]|uniref:energy transducer TonB n=1 Tax=Salinibacter grassmerensis TaxID=3040353 RepID=UPI0021E99319|nr:energy transducer TonB [Salinibacter grassmerensis]